MKTIRTTAGEFNVRVDDDTTDHEIARKQAVGGLTLEIPNSKAAIDWIIHGPRCRDCADNNGVCPNDGTPCDPDMARKAIKTIVDRINYGLKQGYLKSSD